MELPAKESEDMEMITRTPGSTDERRRVKRKKEMLVLIFNIFTSN